ncbi:MAG: dCTP deaminase [Buchnera aphidicola (Eriosoma harunire)]
MRLSDQDIEGWLDSGLLKITPRPDKKHIHGVTVDIKLGNKFRVFQKKNAHVINLNGKKQEIQQVLDRMMSPEMTLLNTEFFALKPGSFVLSLTKEMIILPSFLVGWLDGRSSLARLGLMVHATSHRIDPGWIGYIVLEIYNLGEMTLLLQPGMLIGAISFESLSSKSIRPYNIRSSAKYWNQDSVVISKIGKDI